MLDVYKTCYKLSGEPFRLSPDHHFSFAHPSYAKAEAYLKYAISQGEGFIAITGGPGAGKTTLVLALLAELDKTRIHVAMLKNAQLDPGNLIRMVADSFGLQNKASNNASILSGLEHFLKQEVQRNRRAVLIVDEAQGLSSTSLEELRLLSNLQHDDRLLLQVFLVGQERLLDMVHAPGMEHLLQRLIAASMIEPLDIDETVSYVEHRLCHVDWQGDPAITEEALRLIHKFSGGVPRRINLICHRLFLYGGLEQKYALDDEDARYVIDELQQERLLRPVVADELSVKVDAVTESSNSGRPDLCLPRTESPIRNGQPPQPSNQAGSDVPATDNIITLTQPILLPPRDKVTESSSRPLNERDRALKSADRPARESLPVESGAGPEKNRRWRQAKVFGMFAGLVLIVAIETDFGDHGADFRLAALTATKNRFATTESVPAKKHTIAPDSAAASVTNGHDQPSLTEQNRQLESADEDRKMQREARSRQIEQEREEKLHEARNRQIELEREEKLREARNRQIELDSEEKIREARSAVALAALAQSNNEIGRAVELDGATEQKKIQQLTPETPSQEIPEISGAPRAQQRAMLASPDKDQLKSLLLAGRWNSGGKPAVLFPSDVTYCKSGGTQINCWSTPQNSSGIAGATLYKIEATLRGFSTENSFQVYYRTLMKLVRGKDGAGSAPDESRWQVTEHAMECQFIQSDWIQCHDEDDVAIDYQQPGFTEKPSSSARSSVF